MFSFNQTLTINIVTIATMLLLILCVTGLLRAHRLRDFPTAHPSQGYKDCTTLYMLYNEGVLYFFISWLVQVVMLVSYPSLLST